MQQAHPPAERPPALACDCHFHIFGPYSRYPLSPGRSYSPPEASVPQYLELARTIGIERMGVGPPSSSATDPAGTRPAGAAGGGPRAVAVAVIDDGFDEAALRRLDEAGVRGGRFNLVSGNGTPIEQLQSISRRIAPFGWHLQLYVEGEQLQALASSLPHLPVPVVLDHMGGVRASLGVEHAEFQALLRLLESDRIWLKVCSYRISDAAPWDDAAPNVRAAIGAAPDRCVWGTDWPHAKIKPMPDAGALLAQLFGWVPDADTRRRILSDNPARLYGFD